MTVLIAYDGSAGARLAVEAAARVLRARSAVVLYVHEPEVPALVPAAAPGVVLPPPEGPGDDAEAQRVATEIAREGAGLAKAAGLEAMPTTDIAAGASGAAAAILRAAEANDASAVVIGARGRSGILAALLGSVSDDVVHRARCPVLVVPTPDG